MGSVYEDLDGHEGYAMRRLPDGTMTGSWTPETAVFSSWRPASATGGGGPRPTEEGYEEAIDEWDRRHAQPLVAQTVPRNVRRVVREMRQILSDLVDERPAAGLKAIREVAQWASAIDAQASGVDEAPLARPSGGRAPRLFAMKRGA